MNNDSSTHDEKVHPASREMLADDPLDLHAVEIHGDADLMLRLLVEEYARMGWGLDPILDLARDPFYQSLHGLYKLFGAEEFGRRVEAVLARVGVIRVTTVITPDLPDVPDTLYQLDEESLPSPSSPLKK